MTSLLSHLLDFARKKYGKWLCLWLSMAFLSLGNAFAGDLTEDFDYRLLKSPLSTSGSKKIEVVEFFRYSCPHCNAMAPLIESWAKRNSSHIIFKRVPISRTEEWVPQQQLYYTLQTMGKVEELHLRVFQAIHEQKIHLKTEEKIADFAQSHGIDRKYFLDVFNSPAVIRQARNAAQLAIQAEVESVPSIVVDGRYMTFAVLTGSSNEEVLQIVDKLVSQAISDHKGKN